MNEFVRSFLSSSYVEKHLTFGAEGTGTGLFPIFLLCFVKRCNDKVEFDTGCPWGSLKKILSFVILKM